ncbi:MAG TPA: FkbM family methyltransferase [Rugosimonospora sp.]|nr:FkbM family methyltransferase [Rugosimonospora sp.]
MNLIDSGKRTVRRSSLAVLSRLNPGDVTIRHHYTQDPIRLHSFRHRQYWFRGRNREHATMAMFAGLVRPGDCVFDVGGHIGYITVYLAALVGPAGSVHAFEPGDNNLPYIRGNTAHRGNIHVVPKAVGQEPGELPLFMEDLTGQNNSLVRDFAGLAANERNAVRAHVVEKLVEVVSLDQYAEETGAVPDFVKIDIEGFEYEALRGAVDLLRRRRPPMMVEVQANQRAIRDLLSDLGYRLALPDGTPLRDIPARTENIFCLPDKG